MGGGGDGGGGGSERYQTRAPATASTPSTATSGFHGNGLGGPLEAALISTLAASRWACISLTRFCSFSIPAAYAAGLIWETTAFEVAAPVAAAPATSSTPELAIPSSSSAATSHQSMPNASARKSLKAPRSSSTWCSSTKSSTACSTTTTSCSTSCSTPHAAEKNASHQLPSLLLPPPPPLLLRWPSRVPLIRALASARWLLWRAASARWGLIAWPPTSP